jgi:hypothetical protein
MTKYGLYGAIAEACVAAALLAGAGMDGDTEVLDGEHGFWRMNGSRSCDWDALTDGLGTRWLVAETTYKLFPACQWAMPAAVRTRDQITCVVDTDPSLRRGLVSMAHAFGGLPEEDDRFRELGSSTSRLLVNDAGFERYSGQPRMSAVPVEIEPLR